MRFLPITLLSFFAAPIGAKLSERVPVRAVMGTGMLLVGLGLVLMRGIEVGDELDHAARRLHRRRHRNRADEPRDRVDRDRRRRCGPGRDGVGINSTFRQVGIATGVAALGAVFQARIESKLGELCRRRRAPSPTRSHPEPSRARSPRSRPGSASRRAPPPTRPSSARSTRSSWSARRSPSPAASPRGCSSATATSSASPAPRAPRAPATDRPSPPRRLSRKSVGAPRYKRGCAARASNREPAADRARRAAARRGAERDHGRDRAPARPCSPTRSTCCSAARRDRRSSGPAPRRPGWRASSRSPTGCSTSRSWPRSPPACPSGDERARARPADRCLRADQRLRRRARGLGGRPAGARLAPARLLRPARAPAADARLGPARDPRRLRRRRAARAARRATARRTPRPGGWLASWPSCATARAPASATSTCCASSSPRSRRPRPTPTRRPSWRPSGAGCATPRACARPRRERSAASAARLEEGGARAALGEADAGLSAVQGVDPELDALAERVRAAAVELDDARRAICAAISRRSRPSPGGWRRSRSASRRSTG